MREVQALLGKKKLAISKDENGTGLLHKAVYYNHRYVIFCSIQFKNFVSEILLTGWWTNTLRVWG